jgi:hypothetical protein
MSFPSRRLKSQCRTIYFVVFHAAQFLAAMIAIGGTSGAAALIAWAIKARTWILPLATFTAGVLLCCVIVGMVYVRSVVSRWLLRGYRWVSAEYVYTIHDDEAKHHSQTVTILLEAIRPGVDHFESRYQWSGKGIEHEPQVLSPGHVLMGAPIQRGLWKFYYVHFGRVLDEGERVTVSIRQTLHDDEGKFEPFLAKTVAEPVDSLTLRVVLPASTHPSDVVFTEATSAVPTGSLVHQEAGAYNPATSEIRWDVPSPVFGHRYEIRWRPRS